MIGPDPSAPPDSCAVAFKEWAGICEALADGRQSVILRKGGVAEGPGGFRPEHRAFWLDPTVVHEAEQGLREPSTTRLIRPADGDRLELRALAVVRSVDRVEDLEALDRLAPEHIWSADTIAKRFHYRSPGLWVLAVRIYRIAEPIAITLPADHAGCKTWVPLDRAYPVRGATPALGDREAEAAEVRIRKALDAAGAGRDRS